MYLNEGFPGGGGGGDGFEGRPCKGCQLLIMPGQPVTRVALDHDPNDMSGDYHAHCGKPIESIARVLNMLGRLPF